MVTNSKILGSKYLLSKKPFGPQKVTMSFSVIEILQQESAWFEDGKKKKLVTFILQYATLNFNINKALRASPKEIKLLTKLQVLQRVKKYVFGNLGINRADRAVHKASTSLPSVKSEFKNLVRRLSSR